MSDVSKATSGDEQAPSRLAASSRYRVIDTLGEGGMGVVYRVHDSVEERVIAQKRMLVRVDAARQGDEVRSPSHSGSVWRSKAAVLFQREYHTLAQLAHPNIIEVYDYGVDEIGPYYTMELLDGDDLRSLAPLPWQAACALLRDVAAALTLLHSRRLLHRDISPRNVFRLRSGRAKLIDFGAMAPMGMDRAVAGTPPFVPPETLARQTLDGRADIYALGALAYFLLTGQNAYPARSLSELRDAWRSPPRLPSAYVREIPEALDALVMRMLSLDAQGRPGTAVELVERLTALAGLEHEELGATLTLRAYLTAPTLVGREQALLGVRRRTLRALSGHGASFWVTGPSGVGRSRFLDACALEGKLAGAIVLRVGRGYAARSAFGAARALFEQLPGLISDAEQADFPRAALERSRPRRTPRTSMPPPQAAEPEGSERAAIVATLLAHLTELASRRLLAIVADDIDALDEPSQSLLASLAQRAREHKLVLICACELGAPEHTAPALHVLVEESRSIELAPLTEAEVEELLRSIFGTVPNLRLLATRIHALSSGLPRLCVELSQHLLDRGTIQSRAGGFHLPDSLAISDLPDSLSDAIRLRVAALDADARMLGAVLALSGSASPTAEECIELCAHGDAARTYRAIGDLQALQIINADAQALRLANGYEQAFLVGCTPEELISHHLRLAALFARETDDGVRAARHYFAAGRAEAAVDALLGYARDDAAIRHWFSENRSVLEQGIVACAALGRPTRDAFSLRRTLTRALVTYVEPADREQLLGVANELCELAGLGFYQQQSDLPNGRDRIEHAIALATARHRAQPEHERVLSPAEAIPALIGYFGSLAGYASHTLDVELLHRIPSLTPLAPLVPSIAVVETTVRAARDMRADRMLVGRGMLLEAIAALDAPGHAGFSPTLRDSIRARLISAVGLTEAVLGDSSAWERARQLEALPDHRVNAWRLRYFIHLFRPDARRAHECRREIELLQLQEGPRQSSEGSMIETELLAFVHCDDLLGLARLKPVIDARAQRFPGWVPWSLIVEAELERMRSRFDRALELYPRALALTVPDKDMAWVHGAALHLDALVQAGRAAEAERLGRVWLPFAFEHRLDAWVLIASALALAEAALGDHESAMLRSTEALHELERRGVLGIYYGLALESAARIAIERGDAEAFKQFFARCWEQYGGGAYPPITARLERMLTAARRKQLVDAAQDAAPDASAWPERVRAELGQATDAGDRARRALTLLLESSHAISGHLYGIKGAEIELMASHAPAAPDAALEEMLRDFLRAESDEDRTLALDEIALVRPSMRTRSAADRGGLRYFPFLLATGQGTLTIAAGLVALAFADGKLGPLPAALTNAIGEELLAACNVTGITLAR